jgi:hypothetical protein
VHLTLSEHMHVYVINRLATKVVAVHDDAEAFLATLFFCETLGGKEDMAGECPVILFAQIVQGSYVLLRYDQKMYRCLGGDVIEGNDLVVFIDPACGNLPSHDLAEETIHGVSPEIGTIDSVTGRFEPGQPALESGK